MPPPFFLLRPSNSKGVMYCVIVTGNWEKYKWEKCSWDLTEKEGQEIEEAEEKVGNKWQEEQSFAH